jgi:DNA-binding CsgD family transcriptional regulator
LVAAAFARTVHGELAVVGDGVPAMSGRRALLERGEELRRIAAAVADPGRVLIVEGEAGIGKSALLDAGADLARAAGARVLTARGGSLERDFGYGVAGQLFERPLRAAKASELQRWLAGAAGLAAPVLGFEAVCAAGATEDPAFVAQHGLYWLVSNIAIDGPLVLVVDDLHWADLASFRWLVYLARRLEGLPVLLLVGWRLGEPQAPQDLLDALEAERLAPRALSVAAAGALVGCELGRHCDLGTARACHLATHGNPLLLSQLAQALDADTELPLDEARITELGGRAVGPHVRARLGGLPPMAADVAAAAAVFDGVVAPRQLAALTGLTLGQVREACDRLVEARLLAGRELLEFAHPLVRSAIYDALSPARCAALHRVAADVLDADGLTERAAVHLIAAERTGDAGLVARLVAAAGCAAARGAVDEVVVLLSRALEEPPPLAARYGVLMALARGELFAGDRSSVEHARAALALARGPEEQEVAAKLLADVLSPAGRQREAVDVLARASEQLRAVAPERALRLDVERVSWSFLLARPPRGTGRAAISLAPQVVPGSLSAQTLNATLASGAATTGALPAAAAAELALGALTDPRMLEDRRALHSALCALADCERLDDCSMWIERRREHAACCGSRIEFRVLAAHNARIAWLRGDLATAVDEGHEALEGTETRGYTFFVPYAAASLVAALVERDQLDEAERVLDRHGLAEGVMVMWWLLTPARISLALARGDVRRGRDELSASPPQRAGLVLQLAPSEVAVALASGSPDQAQQRAQAMLVAAERFGAPGALGVARRLLGLTTGGLEGLELLRSAVDSLQLSGRRLELARALVDYGAALRRDKQRAVARDPLRRGLDLAQRCNATALAQLAAEELRASGARPRRLLLTGVESLTPSELRVARLVAQGRSNPEVAQALFVARATVETHLHSIFSKLDVSSRGELPAALAA